MSKGRRSGQSLPASVPGAAANSFRQAQALYAQGRLAEAESLCRSVLERAAGHPGALSLLGIVLAQTRRTQEAAELLGRAAAAAPDSADAHINHGGVLRAVGRHADALACYERALALKPDNAVAHYNRALIQSDLRHYDQALASYERAVGLKPDYVVAWNNRGALLRRLGRYAEALASLERALALKPDNVEAHYNRGLTQTDLGQFEQALASYERAVALKSEHAAAWNNRGAVLHKLGHHEAALTSIDRALAIDPRHLRAHVNRGVTLSELKRFPEALDSLEQALHLGQRDAHTCHCRGAVLQELGDFAAAIASYEQAFTLDPRTAFLRGNYRHARMQVCDWGGFESDMAAVTAALERGEPAATPFELLSLRDSPALQRRAAEILVRERFARTPLPSAPNHPRHDRIRIGYFSADLRNHAVAVLAAELFATHDRSRFELTAFSLGPDVPDERGTGVEAAFDRFLQVDRRTDRDVAGLARQLEIDIAVDLGGYTRGARVGIMALRAAPIQVSYLGYLGTLGGQFSDYLLADPVLVPSEAREHYSEKIAYLPSYQVNSRRPVAERVFTRAELGLPSSGFVFCCFNKTYKITPETFDSWMRILAAVPGSVLFLLGSSPAAECNLRSEAARRGVAPERLVFGRSLPMAEYLARYRSADLFLDTLPYNAGTTTSDALWAGLPVLTLSGESFAARMAASLLTAAELPELIARSRVDYERCAIELATDEQRLEALKGKLAANHGRCRLFDTAACTRNLESLYQQMYERHLSGLPPEHLLT